MQESNHSGRMRSSEVRKKRNALGWSQSTAAKNSKITPNTFRKAEKGQAVSFHSIRSICDALELEFDAVVLEANGLVSGSKDVKTEASINVVINGVNGADNAEVILNVVSQLVELLGEEEIEILKARLGSIHLTLGMSAAAVAKLRDLFGANSEGEIVLDHLIHTETGSGARQQDQLPALSPVGYTEAVSPPLHGQVGVGADVELEELKGTNEIQVTLNLLEQVKRDDEAAWERLIFLYRPIVMKWVQRFGLDYHEAENVSQDVFSSIGRFLRGWEPTDAGDFRSLMKTVTIRRCVNFAHIQGKSLAVDYTILDASSQSEDSASVEVAELYNRVWELIAKEYNERDVAIFKSAIVESLRPDDIAKRENVDRDEIYIVVAKILKRVRAEFGGILD